MQNRTHTCNELRLEDAGKKVQLSGWVENVREVGGNLAFVVLRDFYGTTQLVAEDPEILSAIRWHTLGGPEMTPLEALIYTVDCIEPGRKPYPGIEDSRALAETDIYAAARLCARQSVEYVRRRGGALHPRTLEMLNAEI